VSVSRPATSPTPVRHRWILLFRMWRAWAAVVARRRQPLPELVAGLARTPRSRPSLVEPVRLGRLVWRRLRLGPWEPVCLPRALVLYRMLREEGRPAEIVIGLPTSARSKDAHAWVELDGVDVGPPPGRHSHVELARYGAG
jgi:hypothetical protein